MNSENGKGAILSQSILFLSHSVFKGVGFCKKLKLVMGKKGKIGDFIFSKDNRMNVMSV